MHREPFCSKWIQTRNGCLLLPLLEVGVPDPFTKKAKHVAPSPFRWRKHHHKVYLITTQYVMNYFTQDFPKPAFCLASLCILVSFPCFSIGTTPLVGFAVLFKSMALGGYKHCTDTKN
ncbi:hypothetical protein Peur_042326 [Populus x canadensis]